MDAARINLSTRVGICCAFGFSIVSELVFREILYVPACRAMLESHVSSRVGSVNGKSSHLMANQVLAWLQALGYGESVDAVVGGENVSCGPFAAGILAHFMIFEPNSTKRYDRVTVRYTKQTEGMWLERTKHQGFMQ